MRRTSLVCAAMLVLASACGSDDPKPAEPDQPEPFDAGVSSSTPTGSSGDRGTQSGPPATRDGKKLHTVRFDVRAGDAAFGCGKPAPLGTAATLSEPTDIRFYVHDVAGARER